MAETKEELKAKLGEADVARLFTSSQADEIGLLRATSQRLAKFNTQLTSALRRTLSDLREINSAVLENTNDVVTYRLKISTVLDKLDQFPSPEDVKIVEDYISPEEHAAHQAFYKLTVAQRDNAWDECRRLREENDKLRANISLRDTFAARVTELAIQKRSVEAALKDTVKHRDELQIQFNKTVDERDAAYVELDKWKAAHNELTSHGRLVKAESFETVKSECDTWKGKYDRADAAFKQCHRNFTFLMDTIKEVVAVPVKIRPDAFSDELIARLKAIVEADDFAAKVASQAVPPNSTVEELKTKLQQAESVRDYFKNDSQELLVKYTDSKKLVAATQKWLHACAEKLEQLIDLKGDYEDKRCRAFLSELDDWHGRVDEDDEQEALGCNAHASQLHGGEAAELRDRIEDLIADDNDVTGRDLQHLLDEVDSRDSNAWVEQMLDAGRKVEKLQAQLNATQLQSNDYKEALIARDAKVQELQQLADGRRKVLFEKAEELRKTWGRAECAEAASRLNAEENARLKCEMYGEKGALLKKFSELVGRTDPGYLHYMQGVSGGFVYHAIGIAIDLKNLAKQKETNGSSEEAPSQG